MNKCEIILGKRFSGLRDVITLVGDTVDIFVCSQFKQSNSSIFRTLSLYKTLSGATNPSQSGPGSNGNKGVLCIPQIHLAYSFPMQSYQSIHSSLLFIFQASYHNLLSFSKKSAFPGQTYFKFDHFLILSIKPWDSTGSFFAIKTWIEFAENFNNSNDYIYTGDTNSDRQIYMNTQI